MPVYICTNALCKKNVNLFEADKIISFCLSELCKLKSNFAKSFLENFNRRIVDRRNITAASLVAFLNSKNVSQVSFLEYLTTEQLKEASINLYKKISGDKILKCHSNKMENVHDETHDNDLDPLALMEQRFRAYLDIDCSTNAENLDIESVIDLLSCGQVSDKRIESLSQAMLSIQPTSANPERAFSLAGFFCNKMRNRMSSELLDALVFLKDNYSKFV